MPIVMDILEDDLKHKTEWIKLIEKDALTKSTLKLKNDKYYYLHYKHKGKTVDKYLGKLSEEEVQEWKHKITVKKMQKKQIPEIKIEIELIKIGLNAILKKYNAMKNKKKYQGVLV